MHCVAAIDTGATVCLFPRELIDGKIVDLRKLEQEQESQIASTVNEPSEPYPSR